MSIFTRGFCPRLAVFAWKRTKCLMGGSSRSYSIIRKPIPGFHQNCSPIFMQTRCESTTTTIGNTSIVPDEISERGISALEYMEINSSLVSSSGAGTIFSDTFPVLWTVDLLCALKDLDGITWIQLIFSGTIILRLLVGLPIAVVQQRTIARLENLQSQLKELAEELRKETGAAIRKFGWDEKVAKTQFRKSYKKHWRKLVEENNCHPMRILCLGLLQVPVWICFSSALRNVVFALPLPRTEEKAMRWFEMHQEGLPWLSNLTISDPVVFPLIFLTTNLVNIKLHSLRKAPDVPQSRLQKTIPWIFGGAIVGIAVLACYVPAAVSMYWAISSSAALTQNIALLKPGVRRFLRIPKSASTQ